MAARGVCFRWRGWGRFLYRNPGAFTLPLAISAARPKLLDPELAKRAARIITMGCDVEGVPRIDEDWGLPDPKGQPIERVREIRDLVCRKAGELAKQLMTGSV